MHYKLLSPAGGSGRAGRTMHSDMPAARPRVDLHRQSLNMFRTLMASGDAKIFYIPALKDRANSYTILKLSRNFVLKFPAQKASLRINCWWKGMVVFTPSITYSLNALLIVLIAS